MSSKKYEASGYDLDLDLLTISYKCSGSYSRRCGLLGGGKKKKKKKPFKSHRP